MTDNKYYNNFIIILVVGIFLTYLLGPIIAISITSFNSASFPRLSPWDCWTTDWYAVLAADSKIIRGLKNSLFIGFFVTLFSVILGMAGALLISQLPKKYRVLTYFMALIPVLVPGIVIGISTLVFWGRMHEIFFLTQDITRNGYFLTILGQTSFISSYCMLIFMARLARFDYVQEEAAQDLGATPWQSFIKIMIPYLRPAILSSSVIAFLSSLENYNTSVFTALSQTTFTLELGAKVRQGLNPSISALTFLLAFITITGIIINEIITHRQKKIQAESLRIAEANTEHEIHNEAVNETRHSFAKFMGIEYYFIAIFAVLIISFGGIYSLINNNYQNKECVDALLAEKLAVQQKIEAEQRLIAEQEAAAEKAAQAEAAKNSPQSTPIISKGQLENPNKNMFNMGVMPQVAPEAPSNNPNKSMFDAAVTK